MVKQRVCVCVCKWKKNRRIDVEHEREKDVDKISTTIFSSKFLYANFVFSILWKDVMYALKSWETKTESFSSPFLITIEQDR